MFLHSVAVINRAASVGKGCIVSREAIVGRDAVLGDWQFSNSGETIVKGEMKNEGI